MFGINVRRSVATLAAIAGLLAVAAPAGAQGGGPTHTVTMLDYEGSPVITYNGHAGLGSK
jgi:hypothetical protein